jgi:hypothetical protein
MLLCSLLTNSKSHQGPPANTCDIMIHSAVSPFASKRQERFAIIRFLRFEGQHILTLEGLFVNHFLHKSNKMIAVLFDTGLLSVGFGPNDIIGQSLFRTSSSHLFRTTSQTGEHQNSHSIFSLRTFRLNFSLGKMKLEYNTECES